MKRRKGLGAIIFLIAFSLAQVTSQLSFAGTGSPSLPPVQQQLLARLTTTGGRPISVNGVSATTGDSIGTNAVIETPPGVAATIDLGLLGSIDLPPGSRIKLEFDENCTDPEKTPSTDDPNDRRCKVRATVLAGCVTATPGKKGSRVEIATEQQGVIVDSEKEKKKKKKGAGLINGCAGGAPAGATATGGGLGTGGIIGIITAAIVIPTTIIIIAAGGDNPSNSVP
jgi:hypothetical protein